MNYKSIILKDRQTDRQIGSLHRLSILDAEYDLKKCRYYVSLWWYIVPFCLLIYEINPKKKGFIDIQKGGYLNETKQIDD